MNNIQISCTSYQNNLVTPIHTEAKGKVKQSICDIFINDKLVHNFVTSFYDEDMMSESQYVLELRLIFKSLVYVITHCDTENHQNITITTTQSRLLNILGRKLQLFSDTLISYEELHPLPIDEILNYLMIDLGIYSQSLSSYEEIRNQLKLFTPILLIVNNKKRLSLKCLSSVKTNVPNNNSIDDNLTTCRNSVLNQVDMMLNLTEEDKLLDIEIRNVGKWFNKILIGLGYHDENGELTLIENVTIDQKIKRFNDTLSKLDLVLEQHFSDIPVDNVEYLEFCIENRFEIAQNSI